MDLYWEANNFQARLHPKNVEAKLEGYEEWRDFLHGGLTIIGCDTSRIRFEKFER